MVVGIDWAYMHIMMGTGFVIAQFVAHVTAHGLGVPTEPSIIDFMVQDVCLDSEGRVIPGMSPVDRGCRRRRNLRSGDLIPYHLTKVIEGGVACGKRRLIRDNLLWTHNGVTRVVGAVQIEKDACKRSTPIPAYYSVRWADDEFGFIMGAWSRGDDGGSVGGGLTPQCAKAPHTSRRFFRNWVLASARVPKPGEIGFGVFSKLGSFHGLPPEDADCPTRYPSRYLAAWTRDQFHYSSGLSLDTIVSHPYSQTDDKGETPGRGKQMERTYWTREFGQSRWESWKREDYYGRKAKKTATELAESFNETGTCSPPMSISGMVTPSLRLSPMEQRNGVYSQVATDISTGERHRWIMAACQDMTETIDPVNRGGDPYPSTEPVTERFWDYWTE